MPIFHIYTHAYPCPHENCRYIELSLGGVRKGKAYTRPSLKMGRVHGICRGMPGSVLVWSTKLSSAKSSWVDMYAKNCEVVCMCAMAQQ